MNSSSPQMQKEECQVNNNEEQISFYLFKELSEELKNIIASKGGTIQELFEKITIMLITDDAFYNSILQININDEIDDNYKIEYDNEELFDDHIKESIENKSSTKNSIKKSNIDYNKEYDIDEDDIEELYDIIESDVRTKSAFYAEYDRGVYNPSKKDKKNVKNTNKNEENNSNTRSKFRRFKDEKTEASLPTINKRMYAKITRIG